MTPTSDQLLGVLRTLLAAGGGYVVAKGWIDTNTATALSGAIVTIAIAGWTVYTHSQSSLIRSVNNGDNGVTVVSTAAANRAGITAATAPVN